jgi:hypothetical protein
MPGQHTAPVRCLYTGGVEQSPQMPTRAKMLCRRCTYDLRGLPAGACPECGRHFDPADPATYTDRATADSWTRHVEVFHAIVLGASILHLPMQYATLLAARLALGRWPGPDEWHNPLLHARLDGLMMLTHLSLLGVLCAPAVLAAPLSALVLRRWGSLWRTVGLTVLLWGPTWAISKWDPMRIGVWLYD